MSNAEYAERGGAEADSGPGPRCSSGTRHRVRGRGQQEEFARASRVSPRRDRGVRCVVLRDATRQSCRECAGTAWLGSDEDSSRTRRDAGAGVDDVREHEGKLTNTRVGPKGFVG